MKSAIMIFKADRTLVNICSKLSSQKEGNQQITRFRRGIECRVVGRYKNFGGAVHLILTKIEVGHLLSKHQKVMRYMLLAPPNLPPLEIVYCISQCASLVFSA